MNSCVSVSDRDYSKYYFSYTVYDLEEAMTNQQQVNQCPYIK